jgi:hypothetical protein
LLAVSRLECLSSGFDDCMIFSKPYLPGTVMTVFNRRLFVVLLLSRMYIGLLVATSTTHEGRMLCVVIMDLLFSTNHPTYRTVHAVSILLTSVDREASMNKNKWPALTVRLYVVTRVRRTLYTIMELRRPVLINIPEEGPITSHRHMLQHRVRLSRNIVLLLMLYRSPFGCVLTGVG